MSSLIARARDFLAALMIIAICLGACAVRADSGTPTKFKLQQAIEVQQPQIFGDGSRDADPKNWKATFILTDPTGLECTATAVSSGAILTAAHCVIDTPEGELILQGQKRSLKCDVHADYAHNKEADLALCTVNPALPASPQGFEVINVDPAAPPDNAQITLLGFGCRRAGGVDRGFGRLGEGLATVLSVTADKIQTRGGVTICLGDSGGGAYWAADQGQLQRRLVAVNSLTDLSTDSYLARTTSDLFSKWARSWSESHHQSLCGIDSHAGHCHQ